LHTIQTFTRRIVHARLIGAAFYAFGAARAQPREELVVAAAANLTEAFRQLGARFETETGIHVVFSFGSTAQIAQQAAHGAPFDVIAAADTEHIEALDQQGLLLASSRAIYARGSLAMWIPSPSAVPVRRLQDLVTDQVKIIAVAKPELAPYGAAAIAALKSAGIWERVQSKIVYAENINMARQYGASGNADAVLTAYALVLKENGTVIQIDPKLYPPIDQALGILQSSGKQAEARRFVDFVLRGEGRVVLGKSGYSFPGNR
jgi:molybdate transport system substrate-binding protein